MVRTPACGSRKWRKLKTRNRKTRCCEPLRILLQFAARVQQRLLERFQRGVLPLGEAGEALGFALLMVPYAVQVIK